MKTKSREKSHAEQPKQEDLEQHRYARGSFISDVRTLKERVRKDMELGAVTPNYAHDRETVIKVLNHALATELVCLLRYKNHYFTASGMQWHAIAEEFIEHAEDEEDHADRIAERIQQLGGKPDFNPASLLERSHSEYAEGTTLRQLIEEDLLAERMAIETYTEILRFLEDRDPTTRRLMEDILAKEEEHASDMSRLLEAIESPAARIPSAA
jgi:bacterioferritin